MHLADWQEAQTVAQRWIEQGQATPKTEPSPPVEKAPDVTLAQAWDSYIARAKAKNLRPPTIYKFERLKAQMLTFAQRNRLTNLREFTIDLLEQFQCEWSEGPLSRVKKLDRLKAFFRDAFIRRKIDENPAESLRAPKVRPRPTLPFTREEMKSILAAVETYPDKTGKIGQPNAKRLRALCLVLRYSGMRIGDAVTLSPDRVDRNKLFLYTQKTGQPVYCVLPEFVVEALRTMPKVSERYFFWTGNSTIHTVKGNWQDSLHRLFKLARIQNGYAHRFRDTFSVELLLSGVPIEQVAVLLGHSNSKITAAHYNPWVRSRQEQLERDLQKAWNQDPLVVLETTASAPLDSKREAIN